MKETGTPPTRTEHSENVQLAWAMEERKGGKKTGGRKKTEEKNKRRRKDKLNILPSEKKKINR